MNPSVPQFKILKAQTRDELAQLLASAVDEGWKPVGNPAHARPIFNESFHPFFYQPAIRHVELPNLALVRNDEGNAGDAHAAC